MTPSTDSERSSRSSEAGAGWLLEDEQVVGRWEERLPQLTNRRWRDFSWLTARALLDSANDKVAKSIDDLVNPRRQRWLAAQRAAGVLERFPDLCINDQASARRCIILGDPGEADGSQYAVVEPMLAVHKEIKSDFMVVLSDVIYPAGDVNDYVNALYEAYRDYDRPVYGLPGNHDWYDGLNGFMFNFCAAEALPPTEFRRSSYSAQERLARTLWRRADRPDRTRLLAYRSPGVEAVTPRQPGPYWAMDMEGLRLIAIDTGIKGTLDREQGEWLLRVSDTGLPTVLLTGKPLRVDGDYRPSDIVWGEQGAPVEGLNTVDDIVCHPGFNYVAAIGGDIHNYQRQTVHFADCDRRIEYIVAGGSGAFLSATHSMGKPHAKKKQPEPPAHLESARPEEFRCYPTRGDSLAYFSRWFGSRLVKTLLWIVIAIILAAGVTVVWAVFSGVEHDLGWVMLASFAGAVLTPLAVAGIAWAASKGFPHGYRFVGFSLVLAAVAIAIAGLASADPWWAWEAALIGFGTLLAPLATVLFGYYGMSSEARLRRDLVICSGIVVVAFLGARRHLGLETDVLSIAAAIAATAVLLGLLGWEREKWPKRDRNRRSEDQRLQRVAAKLDDSRRRPLLWVPITLVRYALLPGALIWIYWETDTARTVVAAVVAIVLVLGIVALGLILLGGRRALFDLMFGKGVTGNAALSYLYSLGITETLTDPEKETPPARVSESFDDRVKRICDFLLPGSRGPRKWITSGVSEIGNADTPPMFKSFISLKIEGNALLVTCHGVTGWEADETNPPQEDCVRISLPTSSQPAVAPPGRRELLGAIRARWRSRPRAC